MVTAATQRWGRWGQPILAQTTLPSSTRPPAWEIHGFGSTGWWELSPQAPHCNHKAPNTPGPASSPPAAHRLMMATDAGSHRHWEVAELRQPCSPNKTPSLRKKPQPVGPARLHKAPLCAGTTAPHTPRSGGRPHTGSSLIGSRCSSQQPPPLPSLPIHPEAQQESWDPRGLGLCGTTHAPGSAGEPPGGWEGGFGHCQGWNYSELLPALSSP